MVLQYEADIDQPVGTSKQRTKPNNEYRHNRSRWLRVPTGRRGRTGALSGSPNERMKEELRTAQSFQKKLDPIRLVKKNPYVSPIITVILPYYLNHPLAILNSNVCIRQ